MGAGRAREKSRRWARVAPLLAAGLALVVTWRLTTLDGLPDIGDPFDVAAFDGFSVPDDRNAFTLYRRASARLTTEPNGSGSDWANADEARRRWALANREALDLWRAGAARPEALYTPPRDLTFATLLPVIQGLRSFARLAELEATRLEVEGDFAAALGYHVAVLRAGKHCGHRGVPIERLVGSALYRFGCGGLTRWAAQSRVAPPLLRRAIAEVLAADALTPTVAEVLRGEYVSFVHSLPDPKLLGPELVGGDLPRVYSWPGGRAILEDLPRICRREPERSRRVVRLMFANWLAVADLPESRRPPRAAAPPKRSGHYLLNGDLLPHLFRLDDRAPATARALPPEDLARWWDSTLYARRFTPSLQTLLDLVAGEQAIRASVLVALGNELYRRDHGAYPTRPEDLAGTYLPAPPEAGSLKP